MKANYLQGSQVPSRCQPCVHPLENVRGFSLCPSRAHAVPERFSFSEEAFIQSSLGGPSNSGHSYFRGWEWGALPSQPWRYCRECRARFWVSMGWGLGDPFCLWATILSLCLSSRPAGTWARDGEGVKGWSPGRGNRETAQGGWGKKQLMGPEVGVDIRRGCQGLVGKSRQVSCRLPLCLSTRVKGCCM